MLKGFLFGTYAIYVEKYISIKSRKDEKGIGFTYVSFRSDSIKATMDF